MKRHQMGFSIIELLIVMAIIVTLAALAIPSLLRSKINANEASAVASIRMVLTANETYSVTYGNGYSPDLPTLGGNAPPDCHQANIIDSAIASGRKSGYNFTYVLTNPVTAPPAGCTPGGYSFTIQATPITVGSTGQRSFCGDETQVIRFDPLGALISAPCAGAGLSPLQ